MRHFKLGWIKAPALAIVGRVSFCLSPRPMARAMQFTAPMLDSRQNMDPKPAPAQRGSDPEANGPSASAPADATKSLEPKPPGASPETKLVEPQPAPAALQAQAAPSKPFAERLPENVAAMLCLGLPGHEILVGHAPSDDRGPKTAYGQLTGRLTTPGGSSRTG